MTPPNSTTQDPAAPHAVTHVPPGARSTIALLQRELERRWPGGLPNVDGVSRYALLPTGKLLRPLLVVESACAVGGTAEDVVAAALGLEYLHVGSLIHDDVIDGDATRRGRPTVAARYGTPEAIVAGDALIIGTFVAVTEHAGPGLSAERQLAVVHALSRAGVDLCRGEAMEAELCGDLGCGMDRYLEMIALKTGALFRGACRTGVLLGGGTPEQEHAVVEFAEHLGLAFQMSDDLLPHTSDGAASGKSPLSDVANGRPTFPVLMGHRLAGPAGRRRLEAALRGDTPAAEAHETVREVLESTGALEAAAERARSEAALAEACLSALPPSRSRDVLADVARGSVDRDR